MMPSYHQKYPTADNSQHDGQGTVPEPTPNKAKLSPYDEAAREYHDVLMSQGHNYEPSGNRGSNPCPKDFLLSENARRDRGLRARQVLSNAAVNAGRPASDLHHDTGTVAWEASRGNQHSDSRLAFPLRVKIAVALGSALFVAAVWLLPMLIVKLAGAISHLSGANWLIIGGSVYLLLSIFFFSLVRVAGISDRRAAEMGGGK